MVLKLVCFCDTIYSMNYDLVIDKDIVANPPVEARVPPYQIADRFRSFLINPDMTRDMAIQMIHDAYSKQFRDAAKSSVADMNRHDAEMADKNSEIHTAENELATYMDRMTQQMHAVSTIIDLRNDLNNALPKSVRNVSDDYINDPDEWRTRVMGRMGFLDKLKFRRNDVPAKYNQIVQMTRAAELDAIPDIESKERLSREINQTKRVLERRIDDIQRRVAQIESELTHVRDKINRGREKYSDEMNRDISQFLSVFDNDSRKRKSLRKIPPFINMQNLTEPVAFFQNISAQNAPADYINKIAAVLRRAGLNVAMDATDSGIADPSTYILRSDGSDFIELVTPFYSPDVARQNISAVLEHLAAHGVNLIGVVHPATRSQIDARISGARSDNPDKIAALIQNKLKDAISREDFVTQYSNKNKQGQFLFRGHNFISSDVASSYATPTWRPGRSGLVYATELPDYAYGYSGGLNTKRMAGETIKPQFLRTSNGDIPVGFLTVYKRNAKNVMLDNVGLEAMDSRPHGEFKRQVQDNKNFSETAVSRNLNPVVARYMISGNKIVRIDDNDTAWREIMNHFGPDLTVTHTGEYGAQFIRRLDNIKREMHDNNGVIPTYNLTREQLDKMTLSADGQFNKGTEVIKKLSDKTVPMSVVKKQQVEME